MYATDDGDDDNEAAVSNIEQVDVLVPTTATLTADLDRSVFGQLVRFAITVARTQAGQQVHLDVDDLRAALRHDAWDGKDLR